MIFVTQWWDDGWKVDVSDPEVQQELLQWAWDADGGKAVGVMSERRSQETLWVWSEQRLWPSSETAMKEGSRMASQFLVHLNWWRMSCSELGNVKGGMTFEGEGEFYLKHLGEMNSWDIREEGLSRRLQTGRVCDLTAFQLSGPHGFPVSAWGGVSGGGGLSRASDIAGSPLPHPDVPLPLLKSRPLPSRGLLFSPSAGLSSRAGSTPPLPHVGKPRDHPHTPLLAPQNWFCQLGCFGLHITEYLAKSVIKKQAVSPPSPTQFLEEGGSRLFLGLNTVSGSVFLRLPCLPGGQHTSRSHSLLQHPESERWSRGVHLNFSLSLRRKNFSTGLQETSLEGLYTRIAYVLNQSLGKVVVLPWLT